MDNTEWRDKIEGCFLRIEAEKATLQGEVRLALLTIFSRVVRLEDVMFQTYLCVEDMMISLDSTGDSRADDLRDTLDVVWLALTDEQHEKLDARKVPS